MNNKESDICLLESNNTVSLSALELKDSMKETYKSLIQIEGKESLSVNEILSLGINILTDAYFDAKNTNKIIKTEYSDAIVYTKLQFQNNLIIVNEYIVYKTTGEITLSFSFKIKIENGIRTNSIWEFSELLSNDFAENTKDFEKFKVNAMLRILSTLSYIACAI